jgi:hypothetical protein
MVTEREIEAAAKALMEGWDVNDDDYTFEQAATAALEAAEQERQEGCIEEEFIRCFRGMCGISTDIQRFVNSWKPLLLPECKNDKIESLFPIPPIEEK